MIVLILRFNQTIYCQQLDLIISVPITQLFELIMTRDTLNTLNIVSSSPDRIQRGTDQVLTGVRTSLDNLDRVRIRGFRPESIQELGQDSQLLASMIQSLLL